MVFKVFQQFHRPADEYSQTKTMPKDTKTHVLHKEERERYEKKLSQICKSYLEA